jgi:hypothetical protein
VIHTYYTVALVPAIAALVAIGGAILWRVRETAGARITAALAVAITAAWSYTLLDRTPAWESWLGVLVLATAAFAVIGLLAVPAWQRLGLRGRGIPIAVAVCAVLACIAGPAAYAAQTITTPHTGSIPSAGPGSSIGGGFGPGGGAGFGRGGAGGGGRAGGLAGRPSGAQAGGLQLFGSGSATRSGAAGPTGAAGGSTTGTGRSAGAGVPSGGGGPGGQTTVSSALKKALEADAGKYRWVAAVSGSQTAASLELGTGGEPVMAIGGFNNQGGNLSLAQFKAYVGKGEIHYYIASGSGGGAGVGAGGAPGGGAGPGGGSSSSSAISSWVKAHFKAVTVGEQTLYDLTQAAS